MESAVSMNEEHVVNEEDNTIFALSSGLTGGQATAVAVVRVSGPRARWVLEQFTHRPCPPRVASLRDLRYQGRLLDKALVLFFPAPHSFTGEDVVEFHCHGSRAVLRDITMVLELFPSLRYAEPGEFTARAFAAGKLDLLQVEALADLLASDTVLQKQQALSQLQGDLSKIYQDWKRQLVAALAHAEAIIDFGDDEHLVLQDDDNHENYDSYQDGKENEMAQQSLWGGVTDQVDRLRESMRQQLKHAQRGEWVREGFSVAIVGPPNAGKSSLFNFLAQDEQAAIVSPIQGTTRDVLSVSLNLGGIKCRLLDTAGLRSSTEDVIEQEGMKRTQRAAAQADLILVLLDIATLMVGQQSTANLEEILEQLVPESTISRDRVMLVLNKSDLLMKDVALELSDSLSKEISNNKMVGVYTISCESQQGMDLFLQGLTNHVLQSVMGGATTGSVGQGGGGGEPEDDPIMTRGRHRQHVQAALEALDRFAQLHRQGLVTVDLAAEELRLAASELGRLTGAIDVEEVLDQLFRDFCIGK